MSRGAGGSGRGTLRRGLREGRTGGSFWEVWGLREGVLFPGASVVKNLPANTGDPRSIADREKPTFRRATEPALQTPGANYWVHKPQRLKPAHARAGFPQQEKPPRWDLCTPRLESRPRSPHLEKTPNSKGDPAQPKINTLIIHKKKKNSLTAPKISKAFGDFQEQACVTHDSGSRLEQLCPTCHSLICLPEAVS